MEPSAIPAKMYPSTPAPFPSADPARARLADASDLQVAAGVARDELAGDVARLVRGEEHHQLADVGRLHPGHGYGLQGREAEHGVVLGRVLQVGPELPVHVLVLQHVGVAVGQVERVASALTAGGSGDERHLARYPTG